MINTSLTNLYTALVFTLLIVQTRTSFQGTQKQYYSEIIQDLVICGIDIGPFFLTENHEGLKSVYRFPRYLQFQINPDQKFVHQTCSPNGFKLRQAGQPLFYAFISSNNQKSSLTKLSVWVIGEDNNLKRLFLFEPDNCTRNITSIEGQMMVVSSICSNGSSNYIYNYDVYKLSLTSIQKVQTIEKKEQCIFQLDIRSNLIIFCQAQQKIEYYMHSSTKSSQQYYNDILEASLNISSFYQCNYYNSKKIFAESAINKQYDEVYVDILKQEFTRIYIFDTSCIVQVHLVFPVKQTSIIAQQKSTSDETETGMQLRVMAHYLYPDRVPELFCDYGRNFESKNCSNGFLSNDERKQAYCNIQTRQFSYQKKSLCTRKPAQFYWVQDKAVVYVWGKTSKPNQYLIRAYSDEPVGYWTLVTLVPVVIFFIFVVSLCNYGCKVVWNRFCCIVCFFPEGGFTRDSVTQLLEISP